MPTMEQARLEDVLMQQHPSMRYIEAKNLVMEGRRHLKMSRIQKWDETLRTECERRYGMLQIADTDEDVLKLMESSTSVKPTVPQQPEHTNSTTESSSQSDDTANSPTSNEVDKLQEVASPPTEKVKNEETNIESKVHLQEDSRSPQQEDEINDLTEEEKDRTEAEDYERFEDDDDASDHSQCLTTAEEAGISKAAIAMAIAEAEKAEADDLKFVEERNNEAKDVMKLQTSKKVAISFQPTATKKVQSHKNLEDQVTIDTAENSELSGIPAFIFVRESSSVPANEPLGESYNIPLPLLLANAKKSRVRRLREKLVNRLRRWGLYRRVKATLSENDHEVHFQTLVNL